MDLNGVEGIKKMRLELTWYAGSKSQYKLVMFAQCSSLTKLSDGIAWSSAESAASSRTRDRVSGPSSAPIIFVDVKEMMHSY